MQTCRRACLSQRLVLTPSPLALFPQNAIENGLRDCKGALYGSAVDLISWYNSGVVRPHSYGLKVLCARGGAGDERDA